jgi:uncharacterized membrane protein YbhN (UPF0104 family)
MANGIDWKRFASPKSLPLLLSFLATLAVTFVVAVRWSRLANLFGQTRLPLHRFFTVFAVTSFVSFILPKDLVDIGGRLVWSKQRAGHSYAAAGTALFWDRVMDAIVLFSILPACLVYFFYGQLLIASLVVAIVSWGGAAAIFWFASARAFQVMQYTLNWGLGLASKLPFLRNRVRSVDLPPLDRAACVKLFGMTCLKPVILAVQYLGFAYAMGLHFPVTTMFFATPVSQLAFVFSFTAGGLGVLEAGWFAVLSLAGVSNPDIGLFLLAQRVYSIACMGVLAAATLLCPLAWKALKKEHW